MKTALLQNCSNPDCIISRQITVTRKTYRCSNGEKLKASEWFIVPAKSVRFLLELQGSK